MSGHDENAWRAFAANVRCRRSDITRARRSSAPRSDAKRRSSNMPAPRHRVLEATPRRDVVGLDVRLRPGGRRRAADGCPQPNLRQDRRGAALSPPTRRAASCSRAPEGRFESVRIFSIWSCDVRMPRAWRCNSQAHRRVSAPMHDRCARRLQESFMTNVCELRYRC